MIAAPENVRRYFGRRHALAVGSGTAALTVALESIPAAGRRVLIPALACPNVAVAVIAAGAVPTLVDMDPDTYDVSLPALERALERAAAAVIAVDAFGYPAAVDAIAARARPHGCVVIEDACQAYGGVVDGVPVGARGDIGVVSFGYAKPLELGGGGLILVDDDERAARLTASIAAFGRFSSLKNRLALRFMLRDDYRRMVRWDAALGLLHYRFPGRLLRRLAARFDSWVGDIDAVRAHLDRARPLVAALPGVVPFAYQPGGWLPWRYSFRVASASEVPAITALLGRHGIRASRLYRPVDEFLDVDIEGDITPSRELAGTTLNLSCRTTVADAGRLVDGLERALREVGKRA